MKNIFLGIGSNLGDRQKNIAAAIAELSKLFVVEKISKIIETPPWGDKNQNFFLNAVVEISAEISPENLLKTLKNLEKKLGREKSRKWGPRKIDLDILFFGDEKIKTKNLEIPHKFWKKRNFVILPMAEIAPDFVPPDEKSPMKKIAEKAKKLF